MHYCQDKTFETIKHNPNILKNVILRNKWKFHGIYFAELTFAIWAQNRNNKFRENLCCENWWPRKFMPISYIATATNSELSIWCQKSKQQILLLLTFYCFTRFFNDRFMMFGFNIIRLYRRISNRLKKEVTYMRCILLG